MARTFIAMSGKQISERNIRKELRLNSRRIVKVPLMSKQNQKLRQKFAKEYSNWTYLDWANTMWTDETRFALFKSYERIKFRRESGGAWS